MKRVHILMAIGLLCTAVALAQTTPQPGQGQTQPGQSQPGQAQPGQAQPGQAQPGQAQPGQQPGQAQTQPGQQTAPAAAPAGTRPLPQAKTQEEFQAYVAAVQAAGIEAQEAAAIDFASKFPNSDLRALLFSNLMRQYQQQNNADKVLDMGRKVLEFDPDDPMALTLMATVLAERTRDSDLDRDERLDEATKFAQHALKTVDTSLMVPPNLPAEQVETAKTVLRSMAHTALGTIELAKKNDAQAEQHLQTAVEMNTAQPDAIAWYRLSLAQDRLKKYDQALAAADKALQISQDPTVQAVARQQRERLAKLTGAPAGSQPPTQKPPASPSQQPQTQPPAQPPR